MGPTWNQQHDVAFEDRDCNYSNQHGVPPNSRDRIDNLQQMIMDLSEQLSDLRKSNEYCDGPSYGHSRSGNKFSPTQQRLYVNNQPTPFRAYDRLPAPAAWLRDTYRIQRNQPPRMPQHPTPREYTSDHRYNGTNQERRRIQTSAQFGRTPQTSAARPVCTIEQKDLIRAIFKYVQILHHLHNWNNIPKGIQDNINRLTDNINPPNPDVTFSTKLRSLNDYIARSIQDTVNEHLYQLRRSTKELIINSDSNIIPTGDLKSEVIHLCSKILGTRLKAPARDSYIQEAMDLLPTSLPPYTTTEFNSSIILPVTADPTATTGPTDPQSSTTLFIHPTHHLLPPPDPTDIPTPQVNAHFKRSRVEVDSTPSPVTSNFKRPEPPLNYSHSFPNPSVTKSYLPPSPVTFHPSGFLNQGLWTPAPKPSTRTIIISDAMARYFPLPPESVETHCFPSITVHDLPRLLTVFTKDTKVEDIIICIDLYHSSRPTSAPFPDFDPLFRDLEQRDIFVFLVSLPPGSTHYREGSQELQTERLQLQTLFEKSYHYHIIRPDLDPDSVDDSDLYRIHLKPSAAQKTFQTICE